MKSPIKWDSKNITESWFRRYTAGLVHGRTSTGRKGKAKTQLSSHNLSNNNNNILQHKFSMYLNTPDTVKAGENI